MTQPVTQPVTHGATRRRAARADSGAAGFLLATMVAIAAVGGCGPQLPTDPDAYVVPAVGSQSTRGDGGAVDAYRRVFGSDAVVYQIGDVDPRSGLPAAIVAVVPLGAGASEADVAGRATGAGDVVADRDVGGVKVRSTTSRQGDITLQVRLWRPVADLMVVVIGTSSVEAADDVVSAIARQVGATGGSDG